MGINKSLVIFSLLLTSIFWFVGGASAGDYESLNLHVYPNPFIAGHIHEKGYAKVAFETPAGGTASVYVYDFEGNLVRTLLEGEKRRPGKHEEEWDGRDDNSKLVAPGPYVIVLEVTIQGELYRDSFIAIADR